MRCARTSPARLVAAAWLVVAAAGLTQAVTGLTHAAAGITQAATGLTYAATGPPASASVPGDASLDRSFAGRGFLFTAAAPPAPGLRGARVAVDSRGRLVAVTGSGDRFMAVRYLPGGRLDPSFGTGGVAYVSLDVDAARREIDEASASAIAIQPDGRILIGGSYDPDLVIEGGSGSAQLALVRLRGDGGLDTSFGGDTRLGVPRGILVEQRAASVLAIALQREGILVGGEAGAGPAYVARYNAAGRLDRSFGAGTGMVRFARRRARGAVTGLIALPGGGVYAAGNLGGKLLLARLVRDGIPDGGFGRAGRVLTEAGEPGCGCSLGGGLARDRMGRLLVSGTLLARRASGPISPESPSGGRAVVVARYRPGGALDRSFGRAGLARVRIGARASGGGIAVQPDGRMVVAGSSSPSTNGQSRFTVVRLRSNGERDRSFFGDGVFARSFGALAGGAGNAIVDRSGRVVAAGGAVFGESLATGAQGILLARFRAGR